MTELVKASSGRTGEVKTSCDPVLPVGLAPEAHHLGPDLALTLAHDLLNTGEGTCGDEENVSGVDLQELLVRVLRRRRAARRPSSMILSSACCTPHRDVADRRVLRLATDLVDLVV